MKHWKILAGVVVCVLGGCASGDKQFGEEIATLRPVEPPTYINTDVAELFGNANFSARVEIHKGIPGTRPPIPGDFLGRRGSLLFVADSQRDSQAGLAGGLSVLWDAPSKTGYLLNEPLQGYAPIKNSATNGPLEAKTVTEEMMNGERCRKTVFYQTIRNESMPSLIVWRSVALQDFPIRIESTNAAQAVTLSFSKVKLQAPPAELFALPNGFKAFESTDAMMAELVNRRTEAMDARARANRGKGAAISDDDPIMPQRTKPY